MDFQKILGTFLLGALIGFIVYRTNSLYCGMFAHFSNNAVAVLFSYISVKFMTAIPGTAGMKIQEESDLNAIFSVFDSLSRQQLMAVLFVYGFMFLFILSVFIVLLYALIKVNPAGRIELPEFEEAPVHAGAVKDNIKGLLWLIPGVLLIAAMYYFEVFRFTGAENGLLEAARRILGG